LLFLSALNDPQSALKRSKPLHGVDGQMDRQFRDIFFYRKVLPQIKDRNKTVVAITHDDHYFHLADRVVKLDYGQIELVEVPTARTQTMENTSPPVN
jgi:ABC-type siderophore export system fused ATPase/permease subunit